VWKNLWIVWRTFKTAGEWEMAIWAAALPQRMSATVENTAPAAPRRYMPGAPEIYFRKTIDNSRLVRAVDQERKRELHMFTFTVAICFLMAVFYICQHCRSIQCGYQIEELRANRDQMAEVNRTLKLEEATLKEPGRIDALARGMGMALPMVGQVQRMDQAGALDSGAPIMARAVNVSVISVPN
jgi:cell division protein FtsL